MPKRSAIARGSVRRSGSRTALRFVQRLRRLSFESLEERSLLSVIPSPLANAQPRPALVTHSLGTFDASGSSSPFGLTPNQVRGAYGLGTYASGVLSNGISFGGINGDGSGQTIAIVDAYDDPNALSDLNAFSMYFGLPPLVAPGSGSGPTFQKLNQSGQTSPLPGNDPAGPSSSDWETEESLDIEWAHAMAPMANIILYETSSPSNLLGNVLYYAAHKSGVVAISMSWSQPEFSAETSNDSLYFTTPAGHVGGAASVGGTGIPGGITFLAATGDYGAYVKNSATVTPQYPAASPNVVAVGGTSLSTNGNSYSSESSWGNDASSDTLGGGGGGISQYESQPSYQSGVTNAFSASFRSYPDVSADANPGDGVPVYDSYDFGASTPWYAGYVGGTSLATPLWAGMVAVADQGRAISGLGSLNGKTQTLPLLYQIDGSTPASFHDITTGNSIGPTSPPPSYAPGTGFDLATGIGSPAGNLLIPELAGVAATTTTLGSSTGSSIYGQSVTFTATVHAVTGSAIPTGGTVTFFAGTTRLGSASLTLGTAKLSTTALPAGTQQVTAIYGGTNTTFAGSASGALSEVVNAASLTITANNDSKTYGTPKSFSPTAFTETGLVTANGDSISGVTETSSGSAASAAVGSDAIVPSAATGTGLNNYNISYVNGSLTVNAASLTITANSDSKTYGTPKSFSPTAFTETGLVTANGDSISGVTETSSGSAASAAVGSDAIVPSAADGHRFEQLQYQLRQRQPDGERGQSDDHRQQRQQDLRHAEELQPHGVYGDRAGDGQRRQHQRRD